MVSAKLEAQRQTISLLWQNGVVSAKEIHQKTRIPLRTVERNIQKLKETGGIERKREPSKVTQTFARSLGQHIFQNSALTTRHLALLAKHEHNYQSRICLSGGI